MNTHTPLVNSHSRGVSIFLTILMFFIITFMIVGGNARNPNMALAGNMAYGLWFFIIFFGYIAVFTIAGADRLLDKNAEYSNHRSIHVVP